jgi:hypothetical protein
MSESPESKKSRLRWVTLGEAIAIAALILSGLGLWREWSKADDKPAVVEKERATIPLALRGKVLDDGRSLEISPIEDSHALETLVIAAKGTKIELGSDGDLSARAVEDALGKADKDAKGTQRLPVRITAKYVEAGADKSATGSYAISYKWEGGGLLGGKSLRLVGLNR